MEIFGGYRRHRFISLLNFHVTCISCKDVARKAMRLICGDNIHYICHSCVFSEIERSEFQNRLFICPEDGKEIRDVRKFVSEDKHLREMIDEFFIECKQKCNGCTKVVKVKAIEEHESKCIYSDENMAQCGYCNKRFVREHNTCDVFQYVETKADKLNRKQRELSERWKIAKEKLQTPPKRKNESVDSILELMNDIKTSVEKEICYNCVHNLDMYSKHLYKLVKKVEEEMAQFEETLEIDDENYEVCAICNKWNGNEDITQIDDWLQCDSCEKWFHTICVKSANESMSENDSFICDQCKTVIEQNEE